MPFGNPARNNIGEYTALLNRLREVMAEHFERDDNNYSNYVVYMSGNGVMTVSPVLREDYQENIQE
jgi:malate/lactate dehydrogenase